MSVIHPIHQGGQSRVAKGGARRPGRVFLLLLCVFLAGCASTTGHQVLTFFFDGVPPLEKPGAEQPTEKEIAQQPKPEEKATPPPPSPPPPAPIVRITAHAHPPYAMKMCDSCHEVRGTGGAPMGFMFVEEKLRLCAMCHDDKSQEELGNTYPWVHAPVQYGACIECHHPHVTENPFMMKRWPIQKLCYKCHKQKRLLETSAHHDIQEKDCTDCHDPHASQFRYMLKTGPS